MLSNLTWSHTPICFHANFILGSSYYCTESFGKVCKNTENLFHLCNIKLIILCHLIILSFLIFLLVYSANISFQSNFCERFICIPLLHLFNIQISNVIRRISWSHLPHNTQRFPCAPYKCPLFVLLLHRCVAKIGFPLHDLLLNSNRIWEEGNPLSKKKKKDLQ